MTERGSSSRSSIRKLLIPLDFKRGRYSTAVCGSRYKECFCNPHLPSVGVGPGTILELYIMMVARSAAFGVGIPFDRCAETAEFHVEHGNLLMDYHFEPWGGACTISDCGRI